MGERGSPLAADGELSGGGPARRRRAGIGWGLVWLCQMAAVRARSRCRTRAATPAGVRAPWRGRPSWALRVWLIDSMIWRSVDDVELATSGWVYRHNHCLHSHLTDTPAEEFEEPSAARQADRALVGNE